MAIMRRKKQVEKISVNLIDEKREIITETREYSIPEKGMYKIEQFSGDLILYDSDGDIVKRVNWQAGFSQEYTFTYKPKEKTNAK